MYNFIKIKTYKNNIIIYIVLQFFKYGLLMLPPYCYLFFLNEVITEQRLEKLGLIIILYIFVYLLQICILVLLKYFYNKIFPQIIIECKSQIFSKYSNIDIDKLQQYTVGELNERIQRDTEQAVLYFEKGIEIVISIISIIITIGILIYLNIILAIVSLLVLPLSFYITHYIKGKTNIQYERKRQILENYNNFMVNNMCLWKAVKSNCLEKEQEQRFESLWNDMGNSTLKAHMCWFMNRAFVAFKDVFLTKMGIYLLGGILVIKNLTTVPILLAFMDYYSNCANNFLEVVSTIFARGEQEQSVKRIDEIIKKDIIYREEYLDEIQSIEFKNIDFSYNDETEKIFEDFSTYINKGESVAIVGESGSGKSTLIKLMSGFISPKKGDILWNGKSMDKINRRTIYQRVGFLMQESFLFDMSIRENLFIAKSDANENDIINACRKANILEFIQDLPLGFDTIIGENGVRLSGGQKQRLLIARLFLQNPEVIIFDEATSALDYKNESEILNMLLENTIGKTFIMITHRKTLVDRCTKIIDLKSYSEKKCEFFN